jgi:hypothetical protein
LSRKFSVRNVEDFFGETDARSSFFNKNLQHEVKLVSKIFKAKLLEPDEVQKTSTE